MTSERWSEALDALEAESAQLRAGDGHHVVCYRPPDDLGPLPRSLADRARAVATALDEAAAELRGRLDAIRTELNRIERRGHSSAPSPNEYRGAFEAMA